MNKELSHRSHELKALGWNQEDLSRYEDLWEYSQRWGLINLEREDRQFLKKAENLLPKIQNKKASFKKSIEEKSYYLWLNFYLEEIKIFNESFVPKKKVSVWTVGSKISNTSGKCSFGELIRFCIAFIEMLLHQTQSEIKIFDVNQSCDSPIFNVNNRY